jgi:hypothetical protein
MKASDTLVVVLVISCHVEHRHVRKRLSCPSNALCAAVDVASQDHEVSTNLGQFYVPKFTVKIAEDTDAHFSLSIGRCDHLHFMAMLQF